MSKYLLKPIISVKDVKYSDASKNILPKSDFLYHNLSGVDKNIAKLWADKQVWCDLFIVKSKFKMYF